MANPYNAQTISGYNATPPADDGSQVASNQLEWAKHKTKLADPVKTLSEAINTELLAAFGKLHLSQIRSITTNDTQVAADDRKLISATNTITYTLLAAGTAADGFTVVVLNAGTGVVTIDGDGSETINGATTVALSKQYDAVTLRCDGSNWVIVHDSRTSYEVAINEAKGADVASATTTDIGAATGNYVDVTGTTTITGLGTVQAGTRRIVQFDGALTLTHNASSLILPGSANITTVAGDVAHFVSLGSGDWKCTAYIKQDGTAVVFSGITLDTEQATTSGTSVTFSGIPSTAKRITVMLDGVSGTSTGDLTVELGDAGGIETSGYISGASIGASAGALTNAFALTTLIAASNTLSGQAVLHLEDATNNVWTLASSLTDGTGSNPIWLGAGRKALSGTLTQLRFGVNAGTFDAGSVNMQYDT
ncbi:MAG: hypothetical protein ACR2OV_15790 [Hyphomicrobiaceae bacterium]